MKQSKIGIEWLAQLSKEEQILFCKNRVNHSRDRSSNRGLTIGQYLIKDFDSFNAFIDRAFVWSETPEGHEYWLGVACR